MRNPGQTLARLRWTNRLSITQTIAEANRRLAAANGNKSQAARDWGISVQTFRLRLIGKQTAPKEEK